MYVRVSMSRTMTQVACVEKTGMPPAGVFWPDEVDVWHSSARSRGYGTGFGDWCLRWDRGGYV